MDIEFRKITECPRGTLAALLQDAYSFEPRFAAFWQGQWREFDDFFYDNPHIAEFSGFMTLLNDEPIGFVSWNPSHLPEYTEVGHNCIATKYKGNGYGKAQMQEAVRRIKEQGARKIIVWTNERLISAQRTYESAGFQFVKKSEETICPEYAGQRIHYEIVVR
ncbi:MAG: GNAT family N-acetyltransferase [Clostridiales bacterium]|nr:GNAT family N-acetyltransferase [Clostridiales bacterium]